MKKGIVVLMSILCLGLGGTAVFLHIKEDKKAPRIEFADGEIAYTQGDDYETLLEGVKAVDDKDGDVTDSLLVENVYLSNDGKSAMVVYVARDKDNNIEKISRNVKYLALEMQKDKTEPEKEEETDSQDEIVQASAEDKKAEDEISEVGQQEAEKPEESEEVNLPKGSPQIKLTEKSITVEVGESVDRISYVKEITDDKDDKNTLWTRIQIAGDELDTNTPGTYQLTYYVVDTDGNMSNEAVLTIKVE